MLPSYNKHWTLVKRPTAGALLNSCFELQSSKIPELEDGQYLVKNELLSFDPTQRMWMTADTYMPKIPINTTVRSLGLGRVIASKNSLVKEGSIITGLLGWQEYSIRNGADFFLDQVIPDGVSGSAALSIFGLTGLTAYFGMINIGKVKKDDIVLVSGAAGATGSVAAQVAKILGAKKVIGIAGGKEKCQWLLEKAKIDTAIDYKKEDLAKRLNEEAPDGIDLFFDNVGGKTLDIALAKIRLHARIVLCGAISTYDGSNGAIENYMNLVLKRASMQGFLVTDHMGQAYEAIQKLGLWVNDNQIAYEVDIQNGLEQAPQTLERLFAGKNLGKQLLKI